MFNTIDNNSNHSKDIGINSNNGNASSHSNSSSTAGAGAIGPRLRGVRAGDALQGAHNYLNIA